MVIWLIYKLKKRLFTDGQTDRQTDRWTDGRTLVFLELLSQLKTWVGQIIRQNQARYLLVREFLERVNY